MQLERANDPSRFVPRKLWGSWLSSVRARGLMIAATIRHPGGGVRHGARGTVIVRKSCGAGGSQSPTNACPVISGAHFENPERNMFFS